MGHEAKPRTLVRRPAWGGSDGFVEARLYTWLKFGHLVGLVLLSGGMATQLIASAGLLRAGSVGELRTWQKLPKERLTDGGMGLLIPTGLAMAGQSWSFTDGWILAAIGVLAVTIAAAVAGVGPRNTRLKAALAAAGDGAAAAPAELTASAATRCCTVPCGCSSSRWWKSST